jgi:hypothetical protein
VSDDGLYVTVIGNAIDGYTVTVRDDTTAYEIERTTTLSGARRVGKRLLGDERHRRATEVNEVIR